MKYNECERPRIIRAHTQGVGVGTQGVGVGTHGVGVGTQGVGVGTQGVGVSTQGVGVGTKIYGPKFLTFLIKIASIFQSLSQFHENHNIVSTLSHKAVIENILIL